jgi:hypothetical protein
MRPHRDRPLAEGRAKRREYIMKIMQGEDGD